MMPVPPPGVNVGKERPFAAVATEHRSRAGSDPRPGFVDTLDKRSLRR